MVVSFTTFESRDFELLFDPTTFPKVDLCIKPPHIAPHHIIQTNCRPTNTLSLCIYRPHPHATRLDLLLSGQKELVLSRGGIFKDEVWGPLLRESDGDPITFMADASFYFALCSETEEVPAEVSKHFAIIRVGSVAKSQEHEDEVPPPPPSRDRYIDIETL